MELQISSRATSKKSEAKRLRREGFIPAIMYSKGEPGEDITIDGAAFKKVLNQIEPGTLSTKLFTLVLDGKKRRAILKDIQYHVTTYDVLHLDFEEMHEGVEINVNIPIICTGVMDCAGVKLGGVFRQLQRHLRVRCLPKNIPTAFELDVKDLNIGQSKKLQDIEIPHSVRPLENLKEVAVAVSKR